MKKIVLSVLSVVVLGLNNFSHADSVSNSIMSVGSNISQWFSIVVKRLDNFGSGILDVLGYVGSIFQGLWYGLTSLLSGVGELINDIFFEGDLFITIGQVFNYLSGYLGGPFMVLFSTLFLLILFRIGVAFVFKILRLNIDYHALNNKTRTYNQHNVLERSKGDPLV